jgi:hypothetical protein
MYIIEIYKRQKMEFDCLDAESLTGFDWDDGNVYKNEVTIQHSHPSDLIG